jgi:type VI secretion system protein VasD
MGWGYVGRTGALFLASALVAVTVGCSHAASAPPVSAPAAACPTPEVLRISLTASPRLNPGEKGESLATVVRLYQMKGIAKLGGVSFDDLLDHDKDALGDDFLGMQEVTINPGEKLDSVEARKTEGSYLLAVALFRQPSGTTWHATKKLSLLDPQSCQAADHGKGSSTADRAVRLFLDENRIELR